MRKRFLIVMAISLFAFNFAPVSVLAQNADSLLAEATLSKVVEYALKNQPDVQQSLLDEKITSLQIKSKLAEWYPQINFNYLYQHNFEVQTSIIGGNPVRLGVENTSALQFGATQTIFNRDVLLAKRSKPDIEQQAKQQTTNYKIDVVVNVTKAFYAVLATQQQIRVAGETIVRLERSLKDTRAQFDAGLVDKTDYKRATIALNNAIASKKTNDEALKSRMENLKAQMNYPDNAILNIVYDSTKLESTIYLDTLESIQYTNRIEYQILQTRRNLLETNVKYNKWSYIPSVSANGAYNFNYLDNSFSKLYSTSYPNSYAGLTLAFPIFQGGKRKFNIKQAEFELQRTDLEMVALKNAMYADFINAIAGYKAALANYFSIKENTQLAQEVYDIIQLQYRSGIKTYLEVITAETDLRTSQINYYNALYLLLSNKTDVERALGKIQF